MPAVLWGLRTRGIACESHRGVAERPSQKSSSVLSRGRRASTAPLSHCNLRSCQPRRAHLTEASKGPSQTRSVWQLPSLVFGQIWWFVSMLPLRPPHQPYRVLPHGPTALRASRSHCHPQWREADGRYCLRTRPTETISVWEPRAEDGIWTFRSFDI